MLTSWAQQKVAGNSGYSVNGVANDALNPFF